MGGGRGWSVGRRDPGTHLNALTLNLDYFLFEMFSTSKSRKRKCR